MRQNGVEMLTAFYQRIYQIRKFTPWREDLDLAIMGLQQSDLVDRIMLPPISFDMQSNPNLRRLGIRGN